MKVAFLIIVCSSVLCCCISNARQQHGKAGDIAAEGMDSVNFITDVLPILREKCSPCHFAGGKMYAKMPFDNGETILSHEAGILKRIKDQPAAGLIKQFIIQGKKVK